MNNKKLKYYTNKALKKLYKQNQLKLIEMQETGSNLLTKKLDHTPQLAELTKKFNKLGLQQMIIAGFLYRRGLCF